MVRRRVLGVALPLLLAATLMACGSGSTASSGAAAPTAGSGGATAPTSSSGGASAATSAPSSAGNADNGKQLFASSGCTACHTISGQGGKVGPDLTAVGGRLTPQQISDQLHDPMQRPAPYTQVSGGAVMPKPNLTDAQINDVVAYLSSQKG